jgi:hypothetical protein
MCILSGDVRKQSHDREEVSDRALFCEYHVECLDDLLVCSYGKDASVWRMQLCLRPISALDRQAVSLQENFNDS